MKNFDLLQISLKLFKESKNFTNNERIFTEQILSYWINFIITDNPNGELKSGAFWLPYNIGKNTGYMRANEKMKKGNYLLMKNDEIKMTNDFSSHKCKYWNYVKNSRTSIYSISNENLILFLTFYHVIKILS